MWVEQYTEVAKDSRQNPIPVPQGRRLITSGENPATLHAKARIILCSSDVDETLFLDGNTNGILVKGGSEKHIGVFGGEAVTYL